MRFGTLILLLALVILGVYIFIPEQFEKGKNWVFGEKDAEEARETNPTWEGLCESIQAKALKNHCDSISGQWICNSTEISCKLISEES